MKPRTSIFLALGALLLVIAAACSMPLPLPTTESEPPMGQINTLAAQTIMAQLTQSAGEGTPTPAAGPTQAETQPPTVERPATEVEEPLESPSAPQPTEEGQPTSTLFPTATPQPSVTPLPTSTSAVQPTSPPATRVPCLAARFVRDVTIPDDTVLGPGVTFVKTWRLENVGTCTWDEDFEVIFVGGDRLSGRSANLPERVRPGEQVDVSVTLTTPEDEDVYRGNWMLTDGDTEFGIGGNADRPFFVRVEVGEPEEGVAFNFASSFCAAEWESSEDDLRCPGNENDDDGYVILDNRPELEHRSENEPTLIVGLPEEDGSWVTGEYPRLRIRNGDRFLADVGCVEDADRCSVIFELRYRVGGGATQSLGGWWESYDGRITRIDVDLSFLRDQDVEFFLIVNSNGDYDDDIAFWLNPHIARD